MTQSKALLIAVFCFMSLPSLATAAPSSGASSVNLSSSLGLGYGFGSQEYSNKTFDPKSPAGHLDLQLNLWKVVIGVNYLTLTDFNVGDNRSYVGTGAAHLGVNLGTSLQLIGGFGLGQWRQRRANETTVPHNYDYSASGTGFMAGVRYFIYTSNKFSVGFSGTYYQLTADKYDSNIDGVKSVVNESTKGSAQIVALVIRAGFSDFDKLFSRLK